MTVMIALISAVIAVLAAIWGTLLASKVLFHLHSWNDRVGMVETKATRVENKLNAHDRHDRDAIRDAVDQYLAQLEVSPGNNGDDLAGMMQLMAMFQGNQAPQPQPEPEPATSSNGRLPGVLGSGGVANGREEP